MPERTLHAMKKCLFGNKLNKKVLKTRRENRKNATTQGNFAINTQEIA